MYKPLEIIRHEVHGILWSMEAMRLPMESEGDSWEPGYLGNPGPRDLALATNLVKSGDDHAKAMRGIIVWMKIRFQVGWGMQFGEYRHGVERLSTTSSMHGELKHLSGDLLAEKKQSDLGEKVYTRSLHASYQALRHMYHARRKHRHPDWQIFCDWIETLPHASELITVKGKPHDK